MASSAHSSGAGSRGADSRGADSPAPGPLGASAFALPAGRAAKAAPTLIGDDERFFDELGAALDAQIAAVTAALTRIRREAGEQGRDVLDREGPVALERDQQIHRLDARRRDLRRYGLDLCLGRIVLADGGKTLYVGRRGLTTADGRHLLLDWRSPAAAPFFSSTHGDPQGVVSRRRYHWIDGRITDYWDEVFDRSVLDALPDDAVERAALDDQSAFLATLAGRRTERMRDVLGTIAADQDAVIRADAAGALVVDGGPGTGKTVVALHRTAYLLHSDPRLGHRRGGVLFVGPHRSYLSYVGDVLPSLGEEGVQTVTLADLVPEGAGAVPETDQLVAQVKGAADVAAVVEAAVRFHEEPPPGDLSIETDWSEYVVTPEHWAEAFAVVRETGVPHNEARARVLDAVVDAVVDAVLAAPGLDEHAVDGGTPDGDSADGAVPTGAEDERRALRRHRDLQAALRRAWPIVDAADLVGDLWTVPAYLRRCAPGWTPAQVRCVQRSDPRAWTDADLPWVDAARRRLGDVRRAQERTRIEAVRRDRERSLTDMVEHLTAADDTELQVMSMLRGDDLRNAFSDAADEDAAAVVERTAGPFAHIVVDEAQELTRAQWQMLLARCPGQSFTIAGDRAQARRDLGGSWDERLTAAGFRTVRTRTLTVNYRTPQEVMVVATPVIRAAVPDAGVPVSVRRSGIPVRYGRLDELDRVVADWSATHSDGIACVIGAPDHPLDHPSTPRVRSFAAGDVKGLEFDLVVLIDDPAPPGSAGDRRAWAVDRYVAMTRSTAELVVLSP